MIFGLLPAAGHSRRMGRPKLTLPLGDRTILERVVATLRTAEVPHVLVVTGPHIPELAELARSAGAEALVLPEATGDMRATILHGLQWLEERHHPGETDDLLLIPADHPTLDVAVVRRLLAERSTCPPDSILLPTYQGSRGHPLLLGWGHVAGIRTLPEGVGVNAYLRRQVSLVREVPVDSPGVLLDLDTPEDYERLRASVISGS